MLVGEIMYRACSYPLVARQGGKVGTGKNIYVTYPIAFTKVATYVITPFGGDNSGWYGQDYNGGSLKGFSCRAVSNSGYIQYLSIGY